MVLFYSLKGDPLDHKVKSARKINSVQFYCDIIAIIEKFLAVFNRKVYKIWRGVTGGDFIFL